MNLFDYLLDGANWPGGGNILDLTLQHLLYTAGAVLLAAVLALPLGLLIGHTGRGSSWLSWLGNASRAIPSVGLLFLAVLLLGAGAANIVGVLALVAFPAILTATAAGVSGADRSAVLAGRALGMSERQLVAQVEWPLALPRVVSGVRSATLQVVAAATVAAFASGGGLGRLLTSGQARSDYPQMFAGAVLVTALAAVAYLLLGLAGRGAARRARPWSRTSAAVSAV